MSREDRPAFEPRLASRVESRMERWDPKLANRTRAQLRALAEGGVETAEDAVELLRDDRTKDEWTYASLLLGLHGDRRLAPRIGRALREARSTSLQSSCVSALGMIRGAAARRALLEVLQNSDNSKVRLAVVSNLQGFFDDPKVVPALSMCLSSEIESESVRAQAARSLGTVGVAKAEDPLIKALEDESPLVRYSAAEALATVGGTDALVALQRMAARDRDVVSQDGLLRDAASFAMSNIRRRTRT